MPAKPGGDERGDAYGHRPEGGRSLLARASSYLEGDCEHAQETYEADDAQLSGNLREVVMSVFAHVVLEQFRRCKMVGP